MSYYEVEPEHSSFYTIGVDVTHRCNMKCANCYSPNRNAADFQTEDLIHFFAKLPKKTEIRFTGGEPTLREDLDILIAAAASHGHRVALMTNGLKLQNFDYAVSLRKAGLRFMCLSMNGGEDDHLYHLIDGAPCASQKLAALENSVTAGFFININCIAVKNINESAIKFLVRKLVDLDIKCTLRIRNIGQVGRHMKTDNYTFQELLLEIPKILEISPPDYNKYRIVNGYHEEFNVLFPYNKKIWIKLTDWNPENSTIPDPNSKRRGRLTKSLKVAPFFENVEVLGF